MEEEQLPFDTASEPSSFKLIASLGIAGFISGLILVTTFIYTKPIIEQNKAETLQAAIFKVLPGTSTFETLVFNDGKLTKVSDATEKDDRIYLGLSENGEMTGFAIPGAEPGFQDIIGVIYGYRAADKTIIGFEVLESKETPGLGDKIFKDQDFQTNFTSLSIEPEISIVKKGEKENPNEVAAITGATISSKAIVRLLNNSVDKWKLPIASYLQQNNITLANHE